jgi:hypothetical protein
VNESDEQGRERAHRAAKRRGADPGVWSLVHELHGRREPIRVVSRHGVHTGQITAVDDECFYVHTWPVAWFEAREAEPLNDYLNDQGTTT